MKIFRTWIFKWWEVGLIKLCLLSLGLILGLYFGKYLLEFLWLWWATFILTAVYLMIRVLRKEKCPD